MVATGFATCGRKRRRLAAYDLGQVTGGAISGTLVGICMGGLSVGLSAYTGVSSILTLGAALTLAAMFVVPRAEACAARLSRARQVPQHWARRRPALAGAQYGFVLGAGFATRTPAPWPQLLAVATLASGSLATAWASWMSYGVVRALAPIAARRLGVDSVGIADFTDRTRPAMLASGAAISVAAAWLSLGYV